MSDTALDSGPSGRTSISARALNRIATAVGAEALDVGTRHVKVALSDANGMLGLTVWAPIRVVALKRVKSDPTVVARTGGTVLDRAAIAQRVIRERTGDLTGRQIAPVTVHLTGADIRQEVRVR